MTNYTGQQFHTSQITHTTESARINRKASFWTFTAAMCLFGSTALPSHPVTKIFSMAIAGVLSRVSLRLDAHQDKTLEPHAEIAHNVSEKSYQDWTSFAMQAPKGQLKLVDMPIALSLPPMQLNDIKKALSKPHIMLLGETGSGKSTLVKYLVSHASAPSLVLDSHAAPDDWQNMTVVGMGRQYKAIGNEVENLVNLMNNRYQLRGQGQKDFEPLIVVLDEFPACVANLGKSFTENIMLLVREARKVSIKLIILAQGSEVKTLGIEGQGAIRECFAMVTLGKFALNAAKSLKDEQILEFVNKAQYPAMLDDMPCQLPQINKVDLKLLPLPSDYLMQAIAPVSSLTSAIAYPHLQKIIDYLDGRDWTRDNLIKQSIADFKKRDEPLETIQGYLQLLEVQGHIETRNAGRNGLEAKAL